MPKNRKDLVIQVSNLELDAAFKKWIGTSPIEMNGVNNRIGYWTLKSWLSIPEENRPEGSDNDLRYNYAIRKWSEFQRAIRADKRSQGQRRPSKQRRKSKSKKYRQQAKVKQLLAKKNWGLPRQVFDEIGMIINQTNVTEEDVSTLASEIKQAFKTEEHNNFPGSLLTTITGLGAAKNVIRLLRTIWIIANEPIYKKERWKKNPEREKLRESNPEVRTSKKYGMLQQFAGYVILPSISKVLLGMGWLGLWRVFNTFFQKTVYFKKLVGLAGATAAPIISGAGSMLVAILVTYVIFRAFFSKYLSRFKTDPEKTPQYDAAAARIYEGYDTPKSVAKDYQGRVNEVLRQDITPSEKKVKIMAIWTNFINDVAPSMDKGQYLKGQQEGAKRWDYLKRGSKEEPKVVSEEGFAFYLGFKDLVQQIQLEEEIPKILEENKGEFVKEMKAILSGKKKIPQQVINCVRAEVASIQV